MMGVQIAEASWSSLAGSRAGADEPAGSLMSQQALASEQGRGVESGWREATYAHRQHAKTLASLLGCLQNAASFPGSSPCLCVLISMRVKALQAGELV
eukprot:544738-Pelagomonas_calceolata.AAC.1